MDKRFLPHLTNAERKEWNSLKLLVTQIETRRRRNLIRWGVIMAVVGALFLLGTFGAMATFSDGGASAAPWAGAFCVVMITYLLGNLLFISEGHGDHRAAGSRFEELTEAAKTRHETMLRGDRDSSGWKSERQIQHEWYGSHTELNWQDREIAEMYGIDVETYVSNVLENDRD